MADPAGKHINFYDMLGESVNFLPQEKQRNGQMTGRRIENVFGQKAAGTIAAGGGLWPESETTVWFQKSGIRTAIGVENRITRRSESRSRGIGSDFCFEHMADENFAWQSDDRSGKQNKVRNVRYKKPLCTARHFLISMCSYMVECFPMKRVD